MNTIIEIINRKNRNIRRVINQIWGYPHKLTDETLKNIIGLTRKEVKIFMDQKLTELGAIKNLSETDIKTVFRIVETGLIILPAWETPALIDVKKSELVELYKELLLAEEAVVLSGNK